MNCPFCDSNQITVTNSRPTRSNLQIWRRRGCLDCHHIFTTYEKIDLSFLKVTKRSGIREYYNHAKFYSGIYHAVVAGKGIDRGDAGVLAEKITNQIEHSIVKINSKTVSTQEILNLVVRHLRPHHIDVLLRYLAYFRGYDKTYLTKTFSLR